MHDESNTPRVCRCCSLPRSTWGWAASRGPWPPRCCQSGMKALCRENALQSSTNQIVDKLVEEVTLDKTFGAQIEAVDAHGVERDVQPVVVRGDQDLQGRLRARLPRRALPHLRRRLRLRILLHSHLSPRDQARIDALHSIHVVLIM